MLAVILCPAYVLPQLYVIPMYGTDLQAPALLPLQEQLQVLHASQQQVAGLDRELAAAKSAAAAAQQDATQAQVGGQGLDGWCFSLDTQGKKG
jgi:hypothetical protein